MFTRSGMPRMIAVAAVATLVTAVANPALSQGRLRGIARLGAETGGDKVLEFQYDDGSTPNVTAGGGLLLSAGASLETFRSGGNSVDLQLTGGWKYRTIPKASNQEASWSRFPVEATLAYNTPIGLRLSGGGVMHLGNSLKVDGAAATGDVKFETKPGYLASAEYVFRNGLGIDVRYTGLKYRVSGTSEAIDANSIGMGLTMHFGGR